MQIVYLVEVMAGDSAAATDDLRATAKTLEAVGETNLLATIAGMLANTLSARGSTRRQNASAARARNWLIPTTSTPRFAGEGPERGFSPAGGGRQRRRSSPGRRSTSWPTRML